MGIKELMIMVLFISSFCSAASTTPLGKNSSLDNFRGGRGIAHLAKFGHATGGRGSSGGQPGATNGGTSGDGSHSPYTQGGSTIPLYAAGAGAANNHHPSRPHNGGDSKRCSIGSAALAATILEFLVLYV
ncbi:unnamed protein product [Fraxinus pennsylvanica]|uniref:Glycine-rich protein n=1 Tax=Fraxinus pennsylvanica TaxID=56036 RepID=A0AAD1ZPH3_9LAMI|nr:unnamed protein product [Fraxinus pennsylvanica]